MRYRPFGASGAAISTLTLSLGLDSLTRGVGAASDLIYSALEAGINSYRLETADPVLAEVVGQALSNVDRKLLNVSLELGAGDGRRGSARDFSAEGMTGAIDRALHVSGLRWIDVALLEEPGEDELPQSSLNALKALRATGRVRYLGVSGDSDVMDAYVSTGAFDVLATPFHVNVDWKTRSRMRAAREQDMAILAYDYFPESLSTEKKAVTLNQPKKGLFGFGSGGRPKDDPLAGAGTFAFLHRTPHWTAEAICLAHAMTDPSVSSVMIKARDAERLNVLAEVPEKDMPPGLSAQIEMARVAA
ncbi:aldo/keto reductase [Brevundimonas subvibrioides]|uniref:Aldo/keto reductase n=1 Tax=Brevundimonas subvibrioides (strain ATCC 15264 / DSM 4735 / LMG 14903 / NBRC 16000 / CB 81) TaxID=633149 RepID=D9QPF9_BRESC|nr:aldo/keto reductase [Brevundimonas subvibrioides]ADL02422.1 aldo/keto reductase [Brevundimonas subvibrioides ATCC 15264]